MALASSWGGGGRGGKVDSRVKGAVCAPYGVLVL